MKLYGSMFKALTAGAFLFLAPAAFGQSDAVEDLGDGQSLDDSTSSDEALAAACFNFDRQPRRCENQGCFYNYRTNRCTRGGGGAGRSYFVCEARDNGWEEHWNGHSASGWTQAQARNQALRECRRYHGSCYIVSCYIQR